jgi:hypothetical protein
MLRQANQRCVNGFTADGGKWIWLNGGEYWGVPFTNFLGWFLTVYLIFQNFALYLSSLTGTIAFSIACFGFNALEYYFLSLIKESNPSKKFQADIQKVLQTKFRDAVKNSLGNLTLQKIAAHSENILKNVANVVSSHYNFFCHSPKQNETQRQDNHRKNSLR